jgi:hypothetical protein
MKIWLVTSAGRGLAHRSFRRCSTDHHTCRRRAHSPASIKSLRPHVAPEKLAPRGRRSAHQAVGHIN